MSEAADISVNRLFADIVGRVSADYGSNVSYLFGDWEYISNQLVLWSKSPETSALKFPIICLLSPFTEERAEKTRVELEFYILVNTWKNYTNEEREQYSFDGVLRPVYRHFLSEIRKEPRLDFPQPGVIPHRYTENYRYGRVGVLGADGKPFRDFIDAIEITHMELIINKNRKCYGKRIQNMPRAV